MLLSCQLKETSEGTKWCRRFQCMYSFGKQFKYTIDDSNPNPNSILKSLAQQLIGKKMSFSKISDIVFDILEENINDKCCEKDATILRKKVFKVVASNIEGFSKLNKDDQSNLINDFWY